MPKHPDLQIPVYTKRPIGSVKSLALCLGIPQKTITTIASKSNNLYREVSVPKKDGATRTTFDAKFRLKSVQARIVKKIFHQVWFPSYLHGSIKDSLNPRDAFSNATIHCGAKYLIVEDVEDFFPSITRKMIQNMWLNFFQFPPDVSEILTNLTAYNGYLPQGAKTSSYIANLILWNVEPDTVAKLSEQGIRYSRYVDDICMSSESKISEELIRDAISSIYQMLATKDLKPKRAKHRVLRPGNRLEVTGLSVNGKTPSINPVSRKLLRSEVFNLYQDVLIKGANCIETISRYRSALGKVARLNRSRHPSANHLKSMLAEIKTTLDNSDLSRASPEILKTTRIEVSDDHADSTEAPW